MFDQSSHVVFSGRSFDDHGKMEKDPSDGLGFSSARGVTQGGFLILTKSHFAKRTSAQ